MPCSVSFPRDNSIGSGREITHERIHIEVSSGTIPLVRMDLSTKQEGLSGRSIGPGVEREWHMGYLGGRNSKDTVQQKLGGMQAMEEIAKH